MTSHQQAVDQEKCFGLVGEGGGKLALMLRGISMRFPQSPAACREDQTRLHHREQTGDGRQDGGGGGGGELKRPAS